MLSTNCKQMCVVRMSQLHISLTWTKSVPGVRQGSFPLLLDYIQTQTGCFPPCGVVVRLKRISTKHVHIEDTTMSTKHLHTEDTLLICPTWQPRCSEEALPRPLFPLRHSISPSPSTSIVQIKKMRCNHWTHDLPNHGHIARDR